LVRPRPGRGLAMAGHPTCQFCQRRWARESIRGHYDSLAVVLQRQGSLGIGRQILLEASSWS
jgi:hypothetical protein